VDKAATEQFRLLRIASRKLKSNGSEPQMRASTDKKPFKRGERIAPLLLSLFNNENNLTHSTADDFLFVVKGVIADGSEGGSLPIQINAMMAEIRLFSVRMLSRVAGDVDAATKEKIAASLSGYINDKDPNLRCSVIEAFGSLGNVAEGAALLLLGIAKDGMNPESNTEAIRLASLSSLTRLSCSMPLKVQKEIADMLIDKLEDSSAELRKTASRCLAEISTDHTIIPLFERLKSRVKSLEYRSGVVAVLESIAMKNDLQVKEKVFAFLEPLFLEEENATVKAVMEKTLALLKR